MRPFFQDLISVTLLSLAIQGGLTNNATAQNSEAGDTEATDVADLLRRLEEIEQESRGTAGRATGARTDRLAVVFEDSNLASQRVSTEEIRFLVTRAILINLSDEPLQLVTEEFVLLADGAEFRISQVHEQLRAATIQAGREYVSFAEVGPPDELSIPPGGTAAVWLMYSGLPPAPRVPEMTLKISMGDQAQEININEYQRGVLGLHEERLGPDACLALATVTGELNTINAADFADELDRLAGEGIARIVVSWSENASPLAQQVQGWLLSSRTNMQNGQYNQMPALPASISELHFDRLPGDDARIRPRIGNDVMVHTDLAAAVLAALRTAYEVIPRDELRRQVVSGSPLTRAAALTHGGSRLASEDLSLVLRSMSDPSESVCRGAIAALAHFSEPEALASLMSTVRGDSPELSTAALEALASSRYPGAHSELLHYLEEAPIASRTAIVEVLSRFPRPEWSEVVFDFTSDDDPELRLTALRAIGRVGHARLSSVFADALRDDDERIREFAFARLAASSDRNSEDLAMEYALTILETQPPSGTVISLLTGTRDQQAIPLLLRHLDQPGEHRVGVIQLVARVAGRAAIDVLVPRYDGFNEDEQKAALEILHQLQAPQAHDLALAAILDRRHDLIPQATRILAGNGDSEAVEVLAKVLRSDDQQNWPWACNALKMIGTREARQVLLEARASENANKRRYAAEYLTRLDMESPAHHVTTQAVMRMQDEKYAEADEMLTLAIQFDDEYASAFSHRGFVRLHLEQLAEARLDFEQAFGINPFDSQAVSGMAITRTLQGEYLDGVQMIEENASKFPDDQYYSYNSACVYGRALEQLADAEPTDENFARMEEYRVQGLLLLKRAIELNFEDWSLMRTDPDLVSLRELDEFQALLLESEQETDESAAAEAKPDAEN